VGTEGLRDGSPPVGSRDRAPRSQIWVRVLGLGFFVLRQVCT